MHIQKEIEIAGFPKESQDLKVRGSLLVSPAKDAILGLPLTVPWWLQFQLWEQWLAGFPQRGPAGAKPGPEFNVTRRCLYFK